MQLTPNSNYIHMYIAGEEVVCSNKIEIVEQLTNTNTIILNNCYPLSWEQDKDYKSRFYLPKDYSLFKLVYDFTNEALATEDGQDILTEDGEQIQTGESEIVIFAGVIKRNKATSLRPDDPHFATLQVLDFKTFLSEGDLFNFVIDSMTVQEAINYVINQYSQYNFTVGNLNLSTKLADIVSNYNCNQKTLYDVLEYISQITNSVWTTRYITDTNIAIDFYLLDRLPQGQDLIYDQTFSCENSIVDISYSINSNDYRNKQIMTSAGIKADIITTQEYITVSQSYTTDENINSIVSATLNGSPLAVATTDDKQNGETADLYYDVGKNTFELNEQVLPGQVLIIEYYPQVAGRQVVINTMEVQRIDSQLNNSGVIARYEDRRDADTSAELNAIGQTYMQFKGKPEITLTLKTINNDMYNVGNIVYFNTNGKEGLDNLIGSYAVTKKTIQIIQNNADSSNYIFYIYELSNNFNFKNAVNYFDNQRAKLIGNIKEGEYINRYVESFKNYNIIFSPPVVNGGV